jgi:ketosteroid isomerase-like protein
VAVQRVLPQTTRWEGEMKELIPKLSMIVPLPLLLALILTISFASCSQLNLGDIVREHIQAVNADDVEKNLTFFADDTVFEMDSSAKISGKDQLRGLMESDVVNKARLTIKNIKVEGDTERLSVEQELIKLENAWIDALIKHDWTFIDRILADDYTTTDSEGVILNKAQEMAVIESGEEAITSAVANDFRVRIYGDAAVVTFRWTYKGQVRGKESTGQERYTDTWIRRDGQWQCVAIHASRIAQK